MKITDQQWKWTLVLSGAVEVILFDVSLVDGVGTRGASGTSLWRTQSVPSDYGVFRSAQVEGKLVSEGLQLPLSLKQNHQVLRHKHQICLSWFSRREPAPLADLTVTQQNGAAHCRTSSSSQTQRCDITFTAENFDVWYVNQQSSDKR